MFVVSSLVRFSSRWRGMQDDIDDVLREEAEKKKRDAQAKKRLKTSA